jgi:ribose transport system ATP-binding protein
MAGVTAEQLVRLMVGRDPGDLFPPFGSAPSDELVLRVKGLNSQRLREIDMTLRRGEILGLGGLVGQGQEQLLLALFGAHPHRAEAIEVGGRAATLSSVRAATRLGLAYVPSDRKVEGLHLTQSLHFNLILPTIWAVALRGFRRFAAERTRVAALMEQFGVRGGRPDDPAIQLSGGNQQKLAIAKWLPLNPRVLLLNDPTRGVDVETKRELYLLLRRLAEQGASVILASSDTPELVELCDRVMVLADGRVRALLDRGEISEQAIVRAAVGAEAMQEAAA